MSLTNQTNLWQSYRFPVILLACIALGCILGAFAPAAAQNLSPLGDIFINLMFTAVVPLVFLSVSGAVSGMADLKRLGKIMRNLFHSDRSYCIGMYFDCSKAVSACRRRQYRHGERRHAADRHWKCHSGCADCIRLF